MPRLRRTIFVYCFRYFWQYAVPLVRVSSSCQRDTHTTIELWINTKRKKKARGYSWSVEHEFREVSGRWKIRLRISTDVNKLTYGNRRRVAIFILGDRKKRKKEKKRKRKRRDFTGVLQCTLESVTIRPRPTVMAWPRVLFTYVGDDDKDKRADDDKYTRPRRACACVCKR